MKKEETIRLVWSRREAAAGGRAKAGGETEAPSKRTLSRSRRLWGREDGFTMSSHP